MTERDSERLFQAWSEAATRSLPELDHQGMRRRVLEAHARARAPRSLAARYGLAFAGVAVAAAVLLAVLLGRTGRATFQVAGHDGEVGAWLTAEGARDLPLRFSEGTRMSLAAGSRGRVSQVSADGARIELERGSVAATVTHLPGADWSFGAGPFEVSVLGTELFVSWSPEAGKFELTVATGRALVQGPLLQGPQEVRAGQVCRVDLTRRLFELGSATAVAAATPEQAAPEPAAPAPTPAASLEASGTPAASDPAGAWLGLAQSGKHREALAAAERAGLSNVYRAAPAESLLELAGAARLAGRPDVERAALLACRKRAAGRGPAAQAAYLLGRGSAPAEAAQWFETYLREQPAGLLAREASGRLIESHAAAGNRAAAAQAASRYLAAYPHGPHASMAKRTLGARSESQD